MLNGRDQGMRRQEAGVKTAGVPTVHVIDPDGSTRTAVRELVSGMNLPCVTYDSGREFLAAHRDSEPGCLVLEVKIPDMSGLQIQRRLAAEKRTLPLIFLTGHADVSLAVELMRGGAVHYLQKPLRPMELLEAIEEALAVDRARRRARQRRQRVKEGIARLTAGEREVLRRIAEGRATKVIAADLEVSRRTVELRRVRVMEKLGLKSPTALLHFAILAHRQGKKQWGGARSPVLASS